MTAYAMEQYCPNGAQSSEDTVSSCIIYGLSDIFHIGKGWGKGAAMLELGLIVAILRYAA